MTTDTVPRATETRDAPTGRAPLQPASFGTAVGLVTRREITSRLRSKVFLISTGILLLAVLGSIVIGALLAKNVPEPRVAVVESVQAKVAAVQGLHEQIVPSVADAERLVRAKSVDAALVPSSGPTGFEVIGLDDTPDAVVGALSVAPPVHLLQPSSGDGVLTYLVGLGFGLVFFMSSLTFGQAIAQSVVEEKQTRVVELLIAAIPVRALFAGKVIGNSLLALGQIVAIALLASVGLAITGQNGIIAAIGPSLVWFVVYFIVGFVLVAAVYAALAALVSRQEDVASATAPATFLVMTPYFLILIFSSNKPVLALMSYIPFTSTVGMPMRVFLGSAAWWEPVVSLLILLGAAVLLIVVGARIYENSLLRTGARVKILQALRG